MICSGGGNLKNKFLSKWFSAVLIIVICFLFTISQGSADPILKSVGTLKASKIKKFKVPIITVNVPIQIMNLPEPWRDADLVVMAEAVFHSKEFDWNGKAKGITFGRVIKSQPFKNGSSQGMVHVPLYELQGVITGQYLTLSMVLAKLGDQCKVLGVGWYFPSGTGGFSTEQKKSLENLVDMVMPWNETMTPFM